MKWNLRLAAAHRGIWTASEMQRMLAARGLSVSAGKMSGLWSGSPASVKLGELDVICAVLGCGIEELLLPEPGKVAGPAGEEQRQQAAAPAAGGRRSRPGAATAGPCRRPEVGRTRNPARDQSRSCTDCLAWGVMEQIRCRACRSFRDGNRDERAVHRVRPGAAGEERVLPAVLGPAVRRPGLGRDRAPGGGRPGRGRREDRPSPAVLRPDGTAHGSRPAPAAPRRPRRALPPQAAWVQPGLPSPHARPGRRRRPARPWPPRSASPTASPRPAGGPARSGAGSARDWPSRWTATAKARTSRGHGHCPRCGPGTCAPGTSPRSSARRACWTTTGAPPSTPGWTASSTA